MFPIQLKYFWIIKFWETYKHSNNQTNYVVHHRIIFHLQINKITYLCLADPILKMAGYMKPASLPCLPTNGSVQRLSVIKISSRKKHKQLRITKSARLTIGYEGFTINHRLHAVCVNFVLVLSLFEIFTDCECHYHWNLLL